MATTLHRNKVLLILSALASAILAAGLLITSAVHFETTRIESLQTNLHKNGAWPVVKRALSESVGLVRRETRLPTKVARFAEGLSKEHFSSLKVRSDLKFGSPTSKAIFNDGESAHSYASQFPKSYFDATPNVNARYTWVCPGPSLLEDYHSEVCPLSDTEGFRCCIDAKNGGAVADNMCCPNNQVLLVTRPTVPSKNSLARELEESLQQAVVQEDEPSRHPFQAKTTSYISSRDAKRDIKSYFRTLSSVSPTRRSLSDEAARRQLKKFFVQLEKGTLAGLSPNLRRPHSGRLILDKVDKVAVRNAAVRLATWLESSLQESAARKAQAELSQWKSRSTGKRRGTSVMRSLYEEQLDQRRRADAVWAGSTRASAGSALAKSRPSGLFEVPASQVHLE